MKSVFKLGTRKSLLAWAQSSWVARELERIHPGIKIELVGIETRGDLIQDVPLSSVQGKEFFVAEIDEALISAGVDLTVHSMKDLSLERPASIVQGAVPVRENPRDVILFGPGVLEKIRSGKTLKIGTSSPRRLENIPPFLEKALPHFDGPARASLVEIRGNVNTRLSRVTEAEGSERHLDAVILAFAGLIRLWNDGKGREELTRLLRGVRWMVLPLKDCPAAPAQGALCVECRSSDSVMPELLFQLHDRLTADQVSQERYLLEIWGGGCHQKFGATAIQTDELENVLFIRGVKPDQSFVKETRFPVLEQLPDEIRSWDGTRFKGDWRGIDSGGVLPQDFPAFFIAHSRALNSVWETPVKNSRIWTSGTSSWFHLAQKGIWIEGCAEGFGFNALRSTLKTQVLGLPGLDRWGVLTHSDAQGGWAESRSRAQAQVISTYEMSFDYPDRVKEELRRATHIFWSSGSQYDALKGWVPENASFSCGPGKTAKKLRAEGQEPKVFPSVEEWRKWLKI